MGNKNNLPMGNEKIKEDLFSFGKSTLAIVILFCNFKYETRANHLYWKPESDFMPLICCPFSKNSKVQRYEPWKPITWV